MVQTLEKYKRKWHTALDTARKITVSTIKPNWHTMQMLQTDIEYKFPFDSKN
jgi:hypothetical protein